MAATTEEVPRPYGRGTSSVVSFVVAMNRVDVVDLVVDLVDLDLDVDLVDVDLAVSLCDGPRSVLFSFGLVAPTCFICFWPRRELIFRGLVRQFRQYYFPAVFPAFLYIKPCSMLALGIEELTRRRPYGKSSYTL